MDSSNEIRIVHECEEPITIDIEDVDGEVIRDHFQLDSIPKSLFCVETRKLMLISKPEKLVSGYTYKVVKGRNNKSHQDALTKGWTDEDPWNKNESELKEMIQNAVFCSTAVYETSDLGLQKVFVDNLSLHNIDRVSKSRHGKVNFILAEEKGQHGSSKRLYIAFRGTQAAEDWKDNLNINKIDAWESKTSGAVEGRMHTGFLSRAALVPITRLLESDDSFEEFVICGHSLGGAIATLTAVRVADECKRQRQRRSAHSWRPPLITCITFGAPLVGDAKFRDFCEKLGLASRMFHVVNEGDPVPKLLSYAQNLSALSAQLDNQVRALLKEYPTPETARFYEDKKRGWIEQKDRYMDILSKVIPAIEPFLGAASIVSPKYVGALKLATSLIRELVRSLDNNPVKTGNHYVPIGNYLFLSDDGSSEVNHAVQLSHLDRAQIEQNFETSVTCHLSDTIQKSVPIHHSVEYYENIVALWSQQTFDTVQIIESMDSDKCIVIPREVTIEGWFKPSVISAELVRVCSRYSDILRLRVTGRNLFELVLDDCQFGCLGFPFASCTADVAVRKMLLPNENLERIILEEDFKEVPAIAEYGASIKLATQFGDCVYTMRKDAFRNLNLLGVEQIANDDSVAVVIRRAIQRGMALAQLRREMTVNSKATTPSDYELIRKIIALASVTLKREFSEDLKSLLDKNTASNVLSNEELFSKVQSHCERMEGFLRQPMRLSLEPSMLRKAAVGAAALLSGAAVAYAAGPGLVIVGLMETASLSAAGLAGASGGFLTHWLFSSAAERRLEENYEQVLIFMTDTLLQKLQQKHVETPEEEDYKSRLIQEVTDLREDGKIFSLEKALLMLYDFKIGIENFQGCELEKCTRESKLTAINRIKCIEIVHDIRAILAKQCYVGIVGPQDAGKTTLLHHLWGVGGQMGLFVHTDVPRVYQLHSRLLAVDYPGSTSLLERHCQAFSQCGPMNNVLVVVVPFTGDVSHLATDDVIAAAKVAAMAKSSTRLMVCVNKCGYELPGAIEAELSDEPDPVKYLQQHFATKINEHYQGSAGESMPVDVIKPESILFTDWMVGCKPEMSRLGIKSADAVREMIRMHLLEMRVFEEEEAKEMDKCLSLQWNQLSQ